MKETRQHRFQALEDSVWDFVKKELNERPLSVDGQQLAQWIGMDYGTVLVHIFLPELRQFYNLENLWLIPGLTEYRI